MTHTILGRFGAAHGVRGWLYLNSFTDPIDNIFNYPKWLVQHCDQWQTLHVEQKKIHNEKCLVKIQEINDRELARQYTHNNIAIPRTSLAPLADGDYYWQDLIGTKVITQEGISLGTIQSLMATGSNDVLVIIGTRKHLVPYIDDILIKIDITKKEMIVDWDPDF